MNNFLHLFRKLCLLTVFLCAASECLAWNTLTDDIALTCSQVKATSLECDYRQLDPVTIQKIAASQGTAVLEITNQMSFPAPGTTTAILFVVDTSDPARENVIDKNIAQVEKILRAGPAYFRYGLASFDKDLRIEAPVGSSLSEIISAAKGLRARGKTTELYRNVRKAVAAIAAVQAERKAIILFSDGQAEDRAYFHQDVINYAHQDNVIINSLGYPRTTSLSVALQTLRRLSEESGGVYVEADEYFNLPETFLRDPFSNIDRGGRFTVNLAPVVNASAAENTQITIALTAATGVFSIPVPITNPLRTVPPGSSLGTTPSPPASQQLQPIRIVAPVKQPEAIDVWLWYGIPVAFVILITLTIIILAVTYQQLKIPKGKTGKATAGSFKPFAYLVTQDESGIRHPIMSTTWRIGRTRDNELTLNDKSVSRRHAEIQRYSNGKFIIFDVDSLNGVFVNSEQVKKKKLAEGDIIEIGDIYLRFTTRPADYPVEEDTLMQNTRAPMTH